MEENKTKRYTIGALVSNKSGVLTRITGLFARRGYNIESLTACATEDPNLSRMTIILVGDEYTLYQMIRQMDKLEDVKKIGCANELDCVYRELLLAKVQAALRRAYDYQGQSTLMEHRGMLFNSLDCTVTYEGKQAELTKNENRLMQVLLEHKPNVVSREDLMAALWACDSYVDENALYVNITRLRRKLESIGLEQVIVTKKGLGYLVK